MIGIYAIKNKKTGMVYVGQSVDVEFRLGRHKRYLKKGNHFNLHLQRSYDKHGYADFEFSLIEACEEVDLVARECYWIKYYGDHCYNVIAEPDKSMSGASNPFYGRTHSESTKEKMSAWKKANYLGSSNPNYGKKHSIETRKKMVENHPKTKLNEEQVVVIRSRLANGEKHADIALDYGVNRTAITRINSGLRWSNVRS